MFLLKKFCAEKVIKYNPCPEEVFKNKKPNKEKKRKKTSSTCNTVIHMCVNETSETVEGWPAVVKRS